MTNHSELSKKLALALGWQISHITVSDEVHVIVGKRGITRRFSYTDPTVCLPLIDWLGINYAVHLMRFPDDGYPCRWRIRFDGPGGDRKILEGYSSLPEAVARAVIVLKGNAP